MTSKVYPPWSPEQVDSLNAYQQDGRMHEFTGPMGETLVACNEGWLGMKGTIVQTWAWDWMANEKWREMAPVLREPGP